MELARKNQILSVGHTVMNFVENQRARCDGLRFSILNCLMLVWLLGLGQAGACLAEEASWVEPMRQVHARFTGRPGTITRFGDSISQSKAFFVPLRWPHKHTDAAAAEALAWIQRYLTEDCWTWQDVEEGKGVGVLNGTLSSWPLMRSGDSSQSNIQLWLKMLNPEMAVILWGTNDLARGVGVERYQENILAIVRETKSNGTIPLLTTPPPLHGAEQAAAQFAEAVRDVALVEKVPLVDFHQEILRRGGDRDWNGRRVYRQGDVHEVPRLISGDGCHPSYPARYQLDFGPESLGRNGYGLRNYLTLMAVYDVYRRVIAPSPRR